MKYKYSAIIPARYASSRFPGKPLALLGGRPVILHVLDNVEKAGIPAVVATDDLRIAQCVESAGGVAVMTRADHRCGTDRVREAMDIISASDAGIWPDVVINVQGDEPFIHPSQLQTIMDIFENAPGTDIATLARPVPPGTPFVVVEDPNKVKVVCSSDGQALYFSRSPIPYSRGVDDRDAWTTFHQYLFHIGIYAFRVPVLRHVTEMQPSPLETAESLEQLRWLQAGLKIGVGITDIETIGIDTPSDLQAAEEFLSRG